MTTLPILRLSLLPSPKTLKKPYLPPRSSLRSATPLKSTAKIFRTKPPPPSPTISMSYQLTSAIEQLISSIAYILPFINSLQYGRLLFVENPALALLFEPLFLVLSAYRSVPYTGFVAVFFALYLGVIRNHSFSRYIRFNSMQVVVLDLHLVLSLQVQKICSPSKGLGFQLMVMGYNFIFVFVVACFMYSPVNCALGKTSYLSFIADAASRQL